jgi:hypothetical protein
MSVQMMMLGIVVPAMLATLLASVLAIRLRLKDPVAYKFAGEPSSRDWHPFWVIRFVFLKGFRMVDVVSACLAVISCALLFISLMVASVLLKHAIA